MERPAALNGMGTWRRYKLGQAQFTNWLKQTAEKLVPRTSEPEPAPNRDGDAAPQQSRSQRKKAAKAAAAGLAFEANSANANPEADKSVHWSELEVLAQRVADNADPDDIPDAPLNILRDVVGLRKKSFRFFSSATKDSTDEKVKQSNANHAHIIGVLERVLAKLDGLIKSGRGRERKSQSRDHARVSTADLTNMFSYLELQPAPDAADDVADGAEEGGPSANTKQQHQKATKKKGAKKTRKPREPERRAGHTSGSTSGRASWVDNFDFGLPHESEGEEDEFDLYMRLYCFFEDFNAIRNYVAERWCDYWYDGAVPLDTLAVITNAASELFHQLEYELVNDLRPLHPRLAEYDFMMNMLFLQYGLDHVDYDSYEDLAQDEMDDRIWRDEADWLALTSYFTLQQTLKMIPPGKVPMLPPSNRRPTPYGATNCRAWRDFESNISTQITMECAHLKALKTNEQQPPALPAEPLFLQDFQAYLRRKRYGAALIFSHHVWVDIRHIMEREHARPFEQLQRTATQLQRALESHNPIQYCKDHDFKRGWLGRMWETKHYMLEDFMFDDKKTRFRKIGVEEDPEPFFLLKHEPVWAGLLGFRARLAYSQQGHDFVRLSSVVDAAACLYHAALAVDPSLPPWADMSKYVDTYADDSQFKLGLQERQDPAAIVRKFAALIGQYPQGDKAESRIGDGKEFIPTIAVRQRLYDRYAAERELVAFVEYIDKLATPWLQAQSSAQEQSQNGTAATNPSYGSTLNGDVHTVANGNENAASTNDAGSATEAAGETEEAARRKAMASRLSPVEMLQLLDDIVTSQLEGLLTLDYFKLFDDSVALLEAVSAALGPEVQAGLGPKDGDSHAYLGSLPVVLSQHLDRVSGVEQETEVLAVVAKACRHFVEGKLLQA